MFPLPPLRFENLLLGSGPVLFVLGGFTTTAFIQFVGPRPYQGKARWRARPSAWALRRP
jgi:hypothetical protein